MTSPSGIRRNDPTSTAQPKTAEATRVRQNPLPHSQNSMNPGSSPDKTGISSKIYHFLAQIFSPLTWIKNWVISLFAASATPPKPTAPQPVAPVVIKPLKPTTSQSKPVAGILRPCMEAYCKHPAQQGKKSYHMSNPIIVPDKGVVSLRISSEKTEDDELFIRGSSIIVTLAGGLSSIRFKPSDSNSRPIKLLWTQEQISWQIENYCNTADEEWKEAYNDTKKGGFNRPIQPIQVNIARPKTGWPRQPADFQAWFEQSATTLLLEAAAKFHRQKPELFEDQGPFSRALLRKSA